ncbi:hypothetical protein P7D59_16825 [Enterococcus avium]|uniref:hypothetical protein n=1 Tax=Enterococcus avium TaxID=33945 RepID=UPI00288F742D|nr:hypothetical protein [Enterococcus avium]MDT2480586.1 hypothetical protein [Enterococcus avium]
MFDYDKAMADPDSYTFINVSESKAENDTELRTNVLEEKLEYFQDDNGATVAYNDTIYRLEIKTERGTTPFLVIFESAQELLDEFEQEIEFVTLEKHSDGESFIKEMEEKFSD